MDMQQPMNDAERAAMNIKFEYERAKKLNAMENEAKLQTPAERGTQIHAEMEAAIELAELRLEVSKLTGVANQLRHENLMLKRQGLMQSFVSVMNQPLVDLKHDIMAMQNVAPPQSFSDTAIDRAFDQFEAKAARSPSIFRLALSLTVRVLLVIGVAILVLAWVTK